jgi:hypothetical protein
MESLPDISIAIQTKWVEVGTVSTRDGYQLQMPAGIPSEPGVYRLIADSVGETYVGEAKSLSQRLRNYENAGWNPDPNLKCATNRHVQGWLYRTIQDGNAVRLLVCTEAKIAAADGSVTPIRMVGKYGRAVVESALIECNRDLVHINKRAQQDLSGPIS